MRELTAIVRIRWTVRRARRWWHQMLSELAAAAAAQLEIPMRAVVAVDVRDPGEHSWSRRKWVLVRVHLVVLVAS